MYIYLINEIINRENSVDIPQNEEVNNIIEVENNKRSLDDGDENPQQPPSVRPRLNVPKGELINC
jgi:hypothetical protein